MKPWPTSHVLNQHCNKEKKEPMTRNVLNQETRNKPMMSTALNQETKKEPMMSNALNQETKRAYDKQCAQPRKNKATRSTKKQGKKQWQAMHSTKKQQMNPWQAIAPRRNKERTHDEQCAQARNKCTHNWPHEPITHGESREQGTKNILPKQESSDPQTFLASKLIKKTELQQKHEPMKAPTSEQEVLTFCDKMNTTKTHTKNK